MGSSLDSDFDDVKDVRVWRPGEIGALAEILEEAAR